jgi:cobalt/nickel transport system ATP-binding protein
VARVNVFELDSVSYGYDSRANPAAGLQRALDGISLEIGPGTRVALLGANGSGKSTLLRLLDGLDFPASGTIRFHGARLSRERFEDEAFAFDFRRRVGLVFQNPDAQLFSVTVFDEIAFAPLQLRLPRLEIIQKVEKAMEEMQIADLRGRPPHRLSGGEKKRVALASVLVLDPEVLLLDEPTAGLDPRSQSQILDLLVGWGDGSTTVITATHDLGLVEDVSDFCFVLEKGRIAARGVPADVLHDQDFLARMNLLHAHRHRHPSGMTHAHPHTHPHRH